MYICMLVCDNFLTSLDAGVYFLLFIYMHMCVFIRIDVNLLIGCICFSVRARVSEDQFRLMYGSFHGDERITIQGNAISNSYISDVT